MEIPILLKDLIKNFQQQKEINRLTIEHTESIVERIKKPMAKRFFQTGLSYFFEIILWIAIVACLLMLVLMEKIYPFSLLGLIKQNPTLSSGIAIHDFNNLFWTLRGLFFLLGLSFFILAKTLAGGRKRAQRLQKTSKELESIMENQLANQSAYHALTSKYPVDLGLQAENKDQQRLDQGSPDGSDDLLL